MLVREALETVPAGTVLVVDGKGSRNCALLGDRLAQIACERGLAGVIIHGCIRDSAEIANMPLGVMAIGTCPVKSKKKERENGTLRSNLAAFVGSQAPMCTLIKTGLYWRKRTY